MTERKIVLYLEQKTYSEHYRRAYLKAESRIADYYVFNTFSQALEKVFNKFDIDRKILIDLRRKAINKVAVISWKRIPMHLCNVEIENKNDGMFLTETMESFKDKGILLIFKIDDETLLRSIKNRYPFIKAISPSDFIKDDILITKNRFRSNDFKYRLYLNDRLLVERYYPVDIEHNRMIAETIYFNENAQGTLRIESDFELQIKRVEVDGQKQDIYSSSFLLP